MIQIFNAKNVLQDTRLSMRQKYANSMQLVNKLKHVLNALKMNFYLMGIVLHVFFLKVVPDVPAIMPSLVQNVLQAII
jgi:hypothetical protein